jgi:CubicO group peptidase (beta-lactamase class C family)
VARRRGPLLPLLVLGLASCGAATDQDDAAEPPDPDVALLGHPDSVLFWRPEQQLASFRNYARIFPTRVIRASASPFPLPRALRDLSGVRYDVGGDTFDLADFRVHNHLAGLLVLDDGRIVHEEYNLGNGPDTKWVSYSVTKSVVSMLVGAAVRDGYIGSVDDPVSRYVPILSGGAYEGVSLGNVLQMSSGVAWNEDYTDPRADVSVVIPFTALERLRYLSGLPRAAPPGERFNYSTGETELVGAALRGAVGNNLSTYLEAKIWQAFGMESDADWMLVESGGAEQGGCCLSATLRDYGRVGLFALGGGVLPGGQRVLPPGWMAESTAPSTTNERYGYLWWLGDAGGYRASGIFGQAIMIDPAEQLVVVTHSVWPTPTDPDLSAHRDAFFAAIRDELK